MYHKTKILAILILSGISSSFLPLALYAQSGVIVSEGNFKVLMPEDYLSTIDTISTEIGPVMYHTLHARDSFMTYQISFCDYPEGMVHSDSADLLKEFFQSTIEESVASVHGTKKYESEITQFGYPGWFWKIEFGKNKFLKTKAFVAGNRFYSLIVAGDLRKDDDLRTFAFLDSFQFLELSRVRK